MVIAGACLCGSARAQVTIADWTFETNNFNTNLTAGTSTTLAADGGGTGMAWGNHASTSAVYSAPAGNGSSHLFSSNFWTIGDNYEFEVFNPELTEYQHLLGSDSSNTGPGLYQLQYSTDGSTFNNFGSAYTVLANNTPNPTWSATPANYHAIYHFSDSLSSVAALNNQTNVYFRIEDATSTLSANGGAVATGGTDRIDNVLITGNQAATWQPTAGNNNWDGVTGSWLGTSGTLASVAGYSVAFDSTGVPSGSIVNISGSQSGNDYGIQFVRHHLYVFRRHRRQRFADQDRQRRAGRQYCPANARGPQRRHTERHGSHRPVDRWGKHGNHPRRPGSPGMLTVAGGNADFSAGGVYQWKLGSLTDSSSGGLAGTDWDP